MTFIRTLTMQRLITLILFIMLFLVALRIPVDSDTWWHLRTGKYIVEEQTIPHTDPFSHTRYGEDWIDHSWGAQVVMYGLYDVFGGGGRPGDSGNIGLALYVAGLAVLGMVFVYRMCDGNAYLRAFITMLGAFTASVFWSPRPQMFSFVLSALVLYLLVLYQRKQRDYLWAIPIIMILWSNLHSGFAIGLILLVGSVAGEVLGILLDGARHDRLRKMVQVTVISFVVVILNPYGVRLLVYPLQTVSMGALQNYIQEWGSPDFHRPETWPFLILLLGILGFSGIGCQRLDWTDLVLVIGTALMALLAGRNIAIFALVATPLLARHVDAWLTERGWQIHPIEQVTGPKLGINWFLLLLILLGGVIRVAGVLNEQTMREAQKDYLPVELGAYLDANAPPGNMFNSYNWGGYLMFAAPDVPVYVDGRTDLYDDFMQEYLDIVQLKEGWQVALKEQAISFVAIEADSMLAKMLRTQPDAWTEQQFDEGRSALFIRATTARITS